MSKPHPWTAKVLRDGEDSDEAKRIRMDSWANALTGLNTSRDKTASTLPYQDLILSPLLLEIMYHSSDIAARCVTALPDEVFKRAPKIVSKSAISRAKLKPDDPEERPDQRDMRRDANIAKVAMNTTPDEADRASELTAAVREGKVQEKYHEAMTWGRLYGLGLVLIGANDGNPSWMPLDRTRVKSVDYLTVLDKRDVIPWRWYSNPMAPKFGEVALYQVQPVGVFIGGLPYEQGAVNTIQLVHESRLIRFGGELTSKRERLRNQGSDYSILQKCFRALQLVDNNWQSASVLLADASQGVFKIKGLIDMISQQPTVMQTRMQLVDMIRSVLGSIVLDADGEDFTRVATPLTGVADLLEQSWKRLASAARMPVTMFMGSSPDGMNATGESDMRLWYDTIAAIQERGTKALMEYLLCLEATARGYPNPEEWTVLFPPLKLMTEAEQAKLHLDQANADHLYIQDGVVSEHEVALSRFGGGEYSLETKIDVELRQRLIDLDAKQTETEAENALELAKNPPDPAALGPDGKPMKALPAPAAAKPPKPTNK